MLIGGIALGLVLGLVLGGKLERLADIRLQYLPLLFLAVIIRFGTEALLGFGVEIVDTLRMPLLGAAYGLLLFTLWHNRTYPGLALAFIGIASNGLVILVNGGRMPVWMDAYRLSGLTGELNSVLHIPLETLDAEFFLRLGPLADIIPLPLPPFQNVASIGDLFLTAGLGFFLFATLLRTPAEAQQALDEAREGHLLGVSGTARLRAPGAHPAGATTAVPASTGLSPALEETAALERPLRLGSSGAGLASPALAVLPDAVLEGAAAATAVEARRPRRSALVRVRRHPYVRLALNGSFSALWVGQLISLFGDRVNQIALLFFVFEITKSPLQVALTFVASNLPNLLFSPVAGALVDRWDQKQVLVVSDILRASLVLLVPVAISINVWLAYPIVFLITTVSLFFRPARVSILPRIVNDRELLSANSAMWVGETIADVVNYPLAGLFVLFLGSSVALAFWFDAVTYLASAALLGTMVVPPIVRRARAAVDQWGEPVEGAPPEPEGPPTVADIRRDLKEGWGFLRSEATLLANTLQGTAAQFAVGVVTALGFVIAEQLNPSTSKATYAFMETAIGVGNLVGGFALGLVATKVAKGRLIIAAYTAFGILVVLVGFIPPLPVMLGLMFGIGIANMAFVIPSQTLFQERTPPELMARVVSFRFALVFGGMTVATIALGLVANVTGVGPVVVLAGLISIGAGLAGLFFTAVRDA
jgi:DHA3 family macrolide efflux protein-like MFS transporter